MFKPLDIDNVELGLSTHALGKKIQEYIEVNFDPTVLCGYLVAYITAIETDVEEAVFELTQENDLLSHSKQQRKAESFDKILDLCANNSRCFDYFLVRDIRDIVDNFQDEIQ